MTVSERENLSEANKKICRESADQMLSWASCPPYSILSASVRTFGFLDGHSERKQLVQEYIVESKKDQDLKNAALIHFNFVDTLSSTKEIATADDFNAALLEAMRDKRLTVEYANNLYLSCHKDTWHILEPEKNRYAISKWAAPDLKSLKWQETVKQIRDIVFIKLEEQLRDLTLNEMISSLEKAKTMPIFNEDTSNFRIFGRTNFVRQIDNILIRLIQRLSENHSPKIGTHNYC